MANLVYEMAGFKSFLVFLANAIWLIAIEVVLFKNQVGGVTDS